MTKILIILSAVAALGLSFVSYPDGALATLLVASIAVPAVFFIKRASGNDEFLINVFLIALLARIGLGVIIHIFDLRQTFGPDAYYYDAVGARLAEVWLRVPVPNDEITRRALGSDISGWGMTYIVAFIYLIFGQSVLVAQSFCGVIGALTAPMVYFCAEKIFNNRRVSTISAMSVAVFPSFVVWSSQLLKDGLIIFLLVCAMITILQLRKNLSYINIAILLFSLFGILSLRFYIFYMVVISVAGSFIVGLSGSIKSVFRNIVVIVLLGLGFTYFGVIRNANTDFETLTNLERVQNSRLDLATSADSGFGADVDVSTPSGLLAAIPVGLVYLFFAPFPWEVNKISQALVLPETVLWWMMIPIMLSGLWYTLKHKLRGAIPILIFSLMLTLSYSVFQGNVGMLYRQRTQIQVFLFMFIAVGWTLMQERRENKKLVHRAKRQHLEKAV